MMIPDEIAALSEARARGYLNRSGLRLTALLAWQQWCRASGRSAVVVILGKTKAAIEVDGREVWSGSPQEVDAIAARLARSENTQGQQQMLFAEPRR